MNYTIQPGDTLGKIAAAHRVTVSALLEANPRYKSNPNRITVGDTLTIPEPGDTPVETPAADWLGVLSAKYETGARGPGTVSTGVGDAGGVSYGSYQMTSSGGGTVSHFVAQADFPWRTEFATLVPGSAAFSAKWKEIAAAHAEKFQCAQHAFVKRTHFDPLVARIRDDGLDVTCRSRALQNVVWSTAVQHGPNTPVVHRALEPLKQNGALNVDAANFDKTVIVSIYAERGRKDARGVLVYFSKNSAAVQAGVAQRFIDEQRDALRMLADER